MIFIAVKQKVAARLHDWERLFAAGDIEGLSQIYHENAKIFPYNDFKHDGREGTYPFIYTLAILQNVIELAF